MRKIILSFVVCLLLSALVHAQTAVANTTDLKAALQLKLDEWHKAGSFPGATLGVVHKIAVAVQVNTSVGRSLGKPLSRVLVEMMEVIRAK